MLAGASLNFSFKACRLHCGGGNNPSIRVAARVLRVAIKFSPALHLCRNTRTGWHISPASDGNLSSDKSGRLNLLLCERLIIWRVKCDALGVWRGRNRNGESEKWKPPRPAAKSTPAAGSKPPNFCLVNYVNFFYMKVVADAKLISGHSSHSIKIKNCFEVAQFEYINLWNKLFFILRQELLYFHKAMSIF